MGERVVVVEESMKTSATGADQWLLKDTKTGEHFIASGVVAPFSGWEVLVFPADSGGEITNWLEVAGGPGMSHEGAIEDLEGRLEAESRAKGT